MEKSHTKKQSVRQLLHFLSPPPPVALLSRVKREMWWVSCMCLKEQPTSKTTFLRKRVQTCSAYFSLILRTQNFTGKLGGAGGEPGILQVNTTTQYTMEVLLGDSYPSPAPLCSRKANLIGRLFGSNSLRRDLLTRKEWPSCVIRYCYF